ncbi:hypothetical protein [Oceaniglobus indicus]|uniref:hypothetical protein n=1 Tax=Oceaniglobus indicus TaxID=2047749 RepID=UPI000C18EE50|nr:hypothetical protein [Oceaniglobus indicus]
MIVLESIISHVSRNRDFGMIEARVTLFAKTHKGQPPHPVRIRTHVPARGNAPLRQRLVAEATLLAAFLRREKYDGRTARTAA